MEVKEYEALVGELETRVDRLRSLYDQYFMGIEKTVPSVSHKDVDRRIILLRREQVRNTALRFRFQMIVQRFNTYQTHWQRICRQIEEGTYKRHVLKAKQKMAERERKASGEFSIDVTFEEFAAEATSSELDELDAPAPPMPLTASSVYDDDDFGDKTLAGIPAPAGGAAPAPPGTQGAPHRLGAIALARVPAPRPAAGAPPPVAPTAAPARQPMWRKAEPKIEPPREPPPPSPQHAAPPVPKAAPPMPPPVPKPAPPAPAPRAQPAPAPAAPVAKPAAKPPAKPGDLSDERMRQLYSSYVEAKRARKESTAGITYEQLSKTLQASSEKLREKHGKSVDFEVTIKDGKTILKPIIR